MTAQQYRLLVVTDGSSADAEVLAAAARLVRPGDTDVTLLRVVVPPPGVARSSGVGPNDLLPAIDRAEREARAALRRQACAFPGQQVMPVVLVSARPDDEIARWLAAHPMDEIVLRARERHGLLRPWSGHAAATLARRGHAAVLAVYPAAA